MGIDRAVHLQDRAFAGSDTLATARALALWLKRESFDLILLGKYSLDAETGQVGPEIAELLGIAQITGIRNLNMEGEVAPRRARKRRRHRGVECRAAGAAYLRRAPPSRSASAGGPGGGEKQASDDQCRRTRCRPQALWLCRLPTWVRDVRAGARESNAS